MFNVRALPRCRRCCHLRYDGEALTWCCSGGGGQSDVSAALCPDTHTHANWHGSPYHAHFKACGRRRADLAEAATGTASCRGPRALFRRGRRRRRVACRQCENDDPSMTPHRCSMVPKVGAHTNRTAAEARSCCNRERTVRKPTAGDVGACRLSRLLNTELRQSYIGVCQATQFHRVSHMPPMCM